MEGVKKGKGDVVSGTPVTGPSLSFTTAPKFSGHGSFPRFVEDLEAFFLFNSGFSDEQRLRFLPLCLTGVARDAFDSLTDSQRPTFSQAVESLQEFFASPNSVDAHAQLQALRLDPNGDESLDVFLIRFRKLVHEAYPGSDSDIVLFNSFLSTLPDSYRIDIVSEGITSYTKAVSRTRDVLRAERLRSGAGVTVRQVSEEPSLLQQILDRIEQLEKRMDRPASRGPGSGGGIRAGGRGSARTSGLEPSGRGPTTGSQRACFACGSTSHLKRDCRVKHVTCFNCGERGHIAAICRGPQAGNDRRDSEPLRIPPGRNPGSQ